MNVFDWLSNMDVPTFSKYNVVEVKFKGGRKEYFRNINQIELYAGDPVIVDVPNGHHLGFVSLQGELVRLQMLKKSIKDDDELRVIYRKANEKDLEKHDQAIARDLPTMYRTREVVKELKLNMKLSDVEFQSDNTKAIFYYSSDDRVDFRELIKILAGEFKVRVEMKQISLRQEASRVGGIGVCGRELCCSTWLTDFKNVTTSAARYQNLSLNPVKLSGQCGRLKCCLNYELETYMDALKDIPSIDKPLQTLRGDAILQKTDIFKRIMWFGYRGEESNWLPVKVDKVIEVLAMNEKGVLPQSLEVLDIQPIVAETSTALNADLDKMDKKYSNGKGKSSNNKGFAKHKNERNESRPERNDKKEFKTERKDIKPENPEKKGGQERKERPEQRSERFVNKPKGNNQAKPVANTEAKPAANGDSPQAKPSQQTGQHQKVHKPNHQKQQGGNPQGPKQAKPENANQANAGQPQNPAPAPKQKQPQHNNSGGQGKMQGKGQHPHGGHKSGNKPNSNKPQNPKPPTQE
ncbi:MAG: regulatory iron-sulfur-containing complex subunit RicT [Flectobacillus sp.]|nr:regulatory iron-sulfur-containing complex subunit RicT [Flectobacillus sp.]